MRRTISLGSRKAGALVLVLALGLTTQVANAATDNQAPVADAGSSRYAGQDPVQLDGTGSYDPDSPGPLAYSWRQIAGPSVTIDDANTATPTIWGPMQTDGRGRTVPGPFVQTDAIQECEFELVVSDGELTSLPDTVKIVIVPDFGPNSFQQENPPFDANKPTIIYFGGGDCTNGLAVDSWSPFTPAWLSRANIIYFPNGYTPDSGGNGRTYYKYGDMIIVYLSAEAPDYKQRIQTIGWSTGGQPAVDVGIHLNLIYADARYAINRVTFFDALRYCRDHYSESISTFLGSSVDGEQCWADAYVSATSGGEGFVAGPPFQANLLNVGFPNATGSWYQRHILASGWYANSLELAEMNNFNHGVVAGAYWSVIGAGNNLHLASTPGVETYKFSWYGDASSGYMDYYDKPNHPGRLPEPVTLLVWRYPWLPEDDPNGLVLTCAESENAVGYQFLSGSEPYRVTDYNIVAEGNSCPAITVAMLPSLDRWWTVRVRDAHGSTIYADPIRIDSTSALGALPAELADFNKDLKVDLEDFSELAQHWRAYEPSGDIVPVPNGDGVVDGKELAILAECWLKEVPEPPEPGLVARWKLDETEGFVAHDSVGDHDAFVLSANPLWRPADGQINGALELDGIDDFISVPFVLDPADGPFSVFAWIRGSAPGQVVLSQIGGADWLWADPSDGKLMTSLSAPAGRFPPQPLTSETVITDGDWHRVGFTWDGSNRVLYVDDVEVAKDTQSSLAGSEGGLYIGAGKDRQPGSCFSGLLDDVKIYNRAIVP